MKRCFYFDLDCLTKFVCFHKRKYSYKVIGLGRRSQMTKHCNGGCIVHFISFIVACGKASTCDGWQHEMLLLGMANDVAAKRQHTKKMAILLMAQQGIVVLCAELRNRL